MKRTLTIKTAKLPQWKPKVDVNNSRFKRVVAPRRKKMSTYQKERDRLMEMVQSRGGLAANIAGHTVEEIKEVRDWCDWLLTKRRHN